jgi:VWFA-related protein
MRGVLLALLAPAMLVAQQQPPPRATFKSGVHLIVQTVSVTDKNGKPIEGLTDKDFIITENGVPQPIAFLEYQRLDDAPASGASLTASVPVAPGTPAPAAGVDSLTQPGVMVPRPGDVRYRGRRLLILYFDLYSMPFFDQFRVYGNASKYIETQMTAADMLAVMVFERGRVRLLQDFTDDRGVLRGVIAQLVQAADEVERGVGVMETGSAFGEDNDTFNLFATDRQLAALQTAVTDLGPLPEKKTLIYFGSGLRLSGADNMAQLRATVNAAVRSNVTINPIDTRGLTATPPLGGASSRSPGGIGMFSGALAQAATTRQQQSQDTYYALAKDTGGKAMFDNNDLSLGIVQAARAVTGYYMIGYYTTNTATDGRFRRVNISLVGDIDGELSYRPGYYGAKDYKDFNAIDRERQLEEAFKAEDPITDIPMAMEVNHFQISSAEYFVPISVRMPGSELARPRPAGSTRVEIDMLGEIKDEHGVTLRNSKDRLVFSLDAGAATRVARRSIQYETGFSLLPGSYVIKVLARDTTTGRIGTFQTSFVIPNLERDRDREKARLPISTVVLSTQRVTAEDALYTVKQKIAAEVANPLVFDGQKLIPSVTRAFHVGRPLHVFLQAYQRDSMTLRPVVAYVTFSQGGKHVFETDAYAISEGWDPKLRAVPVRISIPLDDLPPGLYDCQVTVLDPTAGRAGFWRAPVSLVR